MSTNQKFALLGVGLFIVLCLVFSKQIIVYTEVHFTDKYASVLNVTPEAGIALANSTTSRSFTEFYSLKIPNLIPLNEGKSNENFLAFIDSTNDQRYYLLTRGSALSNSFSVGEFCRESDSEPTICNNNYEAVSAILNTSGDDVTLFSSSNQTILNNIKLQIKSDLVPSNAEIVPFSNDYGIRGFIFETNSAIPVIAVDPAGNQYELGFSNMTREEMELILASLQLTE